MEGFFLAEAKLEELITEVERIDRIYHERTDGIPSLVTNVLTKLYGIRHDADNFIDRYESGD